MFEMRVEPEEQQLLPFYGMPVCLVMKDGSQKVGRLTACRSGRVILNGSDNDDAGSAVSRKRESRRKNHPRARKPKESPAAAKPEVPGGDDFDIAPFGPGPQYTMPPPETVPLQAVESVLIL
jgi:hypothetical protein